MPDPSKKKVFSSARFLLPMGAVILLAGVFFFYYYLHISEQAASIDSRAFRALAAISGQFRERVGNYAAVLQRAVNESQKQSASKPIRPAGNSAQQTQDLGAVSESNQDSYNIAL